LKSFETVFFQGGKMTKSKQALDRVFSMEIARVTEAAAIAASHLIGCGDEKAADQAAVDAMRRALNKLEIQGVIVIGEGERDEAPMLYIGEKVGAGSGPELDIALDPLEGTTITAKAMPKGESAQRPGCLYGQAGDWRRIRQGGRRSGQHAC
jgi:hypothetical protein